MFYIIDKGKKYTTAQHETRLLCNEHLRNTASLFGNDPDESVIVEGAKRRDQVIKQLKNGTYEAEQRKLHDERMTMNDAMDRMM